jgi:hypothetical protein
MAQNKPQPNNKPMAQNKPQPNNKPMAQNKKEEKRPASRRA